MQNAGNIYTSVANANLRNSNKVNLYAAPKSNKKAQLTQSATAVHV